MVLDAWNTMSFMKGSMCLRPNGPSADEPVIIMYNGQQQQQQHHAQLHLQVQSELTL
jgi:hypothetical protein